MLNMQAHHDYELLAISLQRTTSALSFPSSPLNYSTHTHTGFLYHKSLKKALKRCLTSVSQVQFNVGRCEKMQIKKAKNKKQKSKSIFGVTTFCLQNSIKVLQQFFKGIPLISCSKVSQGKLPQILLSLHLIPHRLEEVKIRALWESYHQFRDLFLLFLLTSAEQVIVLLQNKFEASDAPLRWY